MGLTYRHCFPVQSQLKQAGDQTWTPVWRSLGGMGGREQEDTINHQTPEKKHKQSNQRSARTRNRWGDRYRGCCRASTVFITGGGQERALKRGHTNTGRREQENTHARRRRKAKDEMEDRTLTVPNWTICPNCSVRGFFPTFLGFLDASESNNRVPLVL